MADSVEFQLKLQDQMSASLRSAAENSLKLDQALSKIVGRLEEVSKGEEKEKESEEGMFTKAVEKGELVKDAIEKIAEKIWELSKELVESTVEITDFGFKAEVALKHLYGEVDGASEHTEAMLKSARKFAMEAALPVHDVTEAFLGLKRAGVKDDLVVPLAKAAGDLAALGGHPENFRQLLDVFENISLKGEVTGRALMSLTQAGVSPAALAAKFGAKDFHDLQLQLSKHPIGALRGFQAIREVIMATAHEKTLGEVLKEDSSTIGGSITKIKNAWDIVLDDVLNKKDSSFGDLRLSFSKLVDDFVQRLPELEIQFAETFGPIIAAVDKFIKDPNAISHVFDEAVAAINAVASVIGPVITAMEWLADHSDVAKAIGVPLAGAAIAGPAGAAVGGAYEYGVARHEEHDRLLQAGYSEHDANRYLGKFADGGPIHETGIALVHEGEYVIPAGGAPVVSGGGGGKSIHAPISININVEGGGSSLTEQGLSLMLDDFLPSALVSPLEMLAATVGSA
jgi:hypothetical protein